MKNIGIIGLGNRLSDVIQYVLRLGEGEVRLSAVADLKPADELKKNHPILKDVLETVRFYNDYEEMLDKEDLDGVMIGTRCSLHARIAKSVINRGIPMFLEKPIATTWADFQMLRDVYKKLNGKTVVSFPLRLTRLVRQAKDIIDSGETGRIEHVSAFNYVTYGGVYFHGWYRDFEETQGLFLQKATHDFDYINFLLGFRPIQIFAMQSQQIYKGEKPYDLRCKNCEEYRICQESPYILNNYCGEISRGNMCCFSKGIRNHDSASVLVRYETGMHVSYTQNFFVRKSVARRGAVLSGYRGTVEFDWGTNEVILHSHYSPRTAVYKFGKEEGHGGGDIKLAKNFIDVVLGEAESETPLESGLWSVLMCLSAKDSAEQNIVVDINFDKSIRQDE